jgi:HEPN domain-containing protein
MSGNRDDAAIWAVVGEWIRSAELDRRAMAACLALDPPVPEVAAFHCQQAAEKILKGFLVLAQQRFRRTHDLEELGGQVKQLFPAVAGLVDQAASWTSWNIAYRYPGEEAGQPSPSSEQLAQASQVVALMATALSGLAPVDKA